MMVTVDLEIFSKKGRTKFKDVTSIKISPVTFRFYYRSKGEQKMLVITEEQQREDIIYIEVDYKDERGTQYLYMNRYAYAMEKGYHESFLSKG